MRNKYRNNEYRTLLRYYRKLQNLSQSDLAERANINEKYYSKIERDENNPTYSVVNKIVNALEMKMTQLSIATDGYCNFDYIFFQWKWKMVCLLRKYRQDL